MLEYLTGDRWQVELYPAARAITRMKGSSHRLRLLARQQGTNRRQGIAPYDQPIDTSTLPVAFLAWGHLKRPWPMMRKLTRPIAERGNGKKALEGSARSRAMIGCLSAAYAEMTADKGRDAEVAEWCDFLAGDGLDAAW